MRRGLWIRALSRIYDLSDMVESQVSYHRIMRVGLEE